MKGIKVLPCAICTPEGKEKDGYTGLPILGMYYEGGELKFAACCPNCGRGNRFDGKETPAEALKAWNNMQARLKDSIPVSTMKKIRSGYRTDQEE